MLFLKKRPVICDPQKIEKLLQRNVEEIFVLEHLKKRLLSGERLRIKHGIDPTSFSIHLGRAVVLRKLRQFQELGHTIVLIIGDFTATIGDPSDKLEKRPMLDASQVRKNMAGYLSQIGRIVDVSAALIYRNSRWLSKINLADLAGLAESFSVQQMIERRNFKERFAAGSEISLREFLYPLMQGYDSVAVKADVEIGGADQLFNLKAGRVVERHFGLPEQDIMTTSMLIGTDGRKMSSSWGNVITLNDPPGDMFGKLMTIGDEHILEYLTLATDMEEAAIEELIDNIKNGGNPKDTKIVLAKEVVRIYHGSEQAEAASLQFGLVFREGKMPPDAKIVSAALGQSLSDLLVSAGIIASKAEFRRLAEAGAIHNLSGDGPIKDPQTLLSHNLELRIGKKIFVAVKVKQ